MEYFELDDYGLGKYTRADAGEQPTVLHLFIKMLEQEYLNGGKLTADSDALTVSGAAGSMFMTKFWGHDQNLTYYVNHVYPIMSGSTGRHGGLDHPERWRRGGRGDVRRLELLG